MFSSPTHEYHGLGSKPLDKGPARQKLQLLGQAMPLNLRVVSRAHPNSSAEGSASSA